MVLTSYDDSKYDLNTKFRKPELCDELGRVR